MTREFSHRKATRERVPLLMGFAGASGSGKTYSALRVASGICRVYGGKPFVIDTESKRSLHYADKFDFEFIQFDAPYGSLDFRDAIRYAKASGAGCIIIDSCSLEHTGEGGYHDVWQAEIDRMAGNDYAKRERVKMLAIQKAQAPRKKLIEEITTKNCPPIIFCFRAKHSAKPVRNNGKTEVVDMGYTPVGSEDWVFECSLSTIFYPGSNGVPIWSSQFPGERQAIKMPEQFRWLEAHNSPLDEGIGEKLAIWAMGDEYKLAQPAADPINDYAKRLAAAIKSGDGASFWAETEPERDTLAIPDDRLEKMAAAVTKSKNT